MVTMTSSSPAMELTNEHGELQSHEQQLGEDNSVPIVLRDDSLPEAYSGWSVNGAAAAGVAVDAAGAYIHSAQQNNGSSNYLIDGSADQFSELSFEQLIAIQKEMLRNFTHNVNDPEFDILRRPAWRGLTMALYITVILVGMIGNFIVVFVVVKNRNMQNVTNLFIANLALSDIWLCLFSLPIQLYYQLTDHWVFGETLCRVVFAAFAVPIYVSTLTILLIALDRYWLIVYPLRDRMSIKTALILISVIIVLSLLLAIPVIWFTSLHKLDQPDLRIFRNYCVEKWPTVVGRKVYSASMFLLQFCLPLSMTAVLYYKIYCRLKQRPLQRQNTNQERKQKTNKILFAIVTLFVICWLPWNVFSLLTELDHGIVKGAHFKFVDLLLKVFAMSSSCINPFLYCWLNDNFRKELDSMAFKMKLIRERPSSRRTSPQYQIQPTADAMDESNIHNAVTMDIITADMSTSRLSITRTSTTRLSSGSIGMDILAARGGRGSIDSTGQRNSIVAAQQSAFGRSGSDGPRNSIVGPQQSGFGSHLTVPL